MYAKETLQAYIGSYFYCFSEYVTSTEDMAISDKLKVRPI